jgi:hypothetical protein
MRANPRSNIGRRPHSVRATSDQRLATNVFPTSGFRLPIASDAPDRSPSVWLRESCVGRMNSPLQRVVDGQGGAGSYPAIPDRSHQRPKWPSASASGSRLPTSGIVPANAPSDSMTRRRGGFTRPIQDAGEPSIQHRSPAPIPYERPATSDQRRMSFRLPASDCVGRSRPIAARHGCVNRVLGE